MGSTGGSIAEMIGVGEETVTKGTIPLLEPTLLGPTIQWISAAKSTMPAWEDGILQQEHLARRKVTTSVILLCALA